MNDESDDQCSSVRRRSEEHGERFSFVVPYRYLGAVPVHSSSRSDILEVEGGLMVFPLHNI